MLRDLKQEAKIEAEVARALRPPSTVHQGADQHTGVADTARDVVPAPGRTVPR